VAENISLGEAKGLLADFGEMERKAGEISKAISRKARILIMDEPTAPLTTKEVDRLFAMSKAMKRDGISVIYISHRTDELFGISDRVTVLRDGKYVATIETRLADRRELIGLMAGRELSESYPASRLKPRGTSMEVRGLCGAGCGEVSFSLRGGEILVVSGLVDAARTEIARTIYGADRRTAGEVLVGGKPAPIRPPRDAIRRGIGLVPEGRMGQGCFLDMDIRWNLWIQSIRRLSKGLVVDARAERENGELYAKALGIKARGPGAMVEALNGGNHQKVAPARVLAARTTILIFVDPARGIDVGAKQEIYSLMLELVDEGHSIIGGNEEAARLAGINIKAIKLSVFTLCGFFAALSSIILVAREGSTNSSVGAGTEFTCIAAALLGGVSLRGVEGKVWGAVAGALIFGVLATDMQIVGLGIYPRYVARCLGLLAAVSIDSHQKSMGSRKLAEAIS
jgi:ribose transport system ATP-binding protein